MSRLIIDTQKGLVSLTFPIIVVLSAYRALVDGGCRAEWMILVAEDVVGVA